MIQIVQSPDSLVAKINDAKTGDTVFIPSGSYETSETLVVPENVNVFTDPGTTIKPTGNFPAISIGANSKWVNGTVILPKGSTSTGFLVSPNQTKSNNVYAIGTCIRDVYIVGRDGGKGIVLEISKTTGYSVIEYCVFDRITCEWLETAIEITGDDSVGWINACNFDHLVFESCINNLIIEKGHSGHSFKGIQLQTQNGTKSIIRNAGGFNRFEGMIWDMYGKIPTPTPMIIIESSAKNTIMDMNIDHTSGYVQDSGTNTKWVGLASM